MLPAYFRYAFFAFYPAKNYCQFLFRFPFPSFHLQPVLFHREGVYFDVYIFEKSITPENWQKNYNVYLGATFNLGHNLMQMLYFRPHNKFEEIENCYLVGGGTHPGSGLPTIYESGRITANLISKRYGIDFFSKNTQTG